MSYILSIDQGTTSTRSLIFDADWAVMATAQQEFPQHFPNSGWVEHDPMDLWHTTLSTARDAIAQAGLSASDIAAIGITNQRETTVLWDKHSGKPVYNAIVWQDRRTAQFCEELSKTDFPDVVRTQTGLLVDPYFSSTKLAWLLDEHPDLRARAQAGDLLFGTVDTWLIWNLTGGARHVTDATNAARTMLYNIHTGEWSNEICTHLNIPRNILPEVLDCSADFGIAAAEHLGAEIPIYGVAGDQQAATIGQACFEAGMLKSTYGTGCFALLNTGATPVTSHNRLLTTVAYQLDGKTTYALEGSIFIAGAVVQWLRDGLGILDNAAQTAQMARDADANQNVIIVPAFTGLGAPYWNAQCRGATYGLTRNSGPNEMAKAALESVGYQTRDLLDAMKADMGQDLETIIRVDGGMAASDEAMQFLADICDADVRRPKVLETTAMGAAWLAGHRAGICGDQASFAKAWRTEAQFMAKMDATTRDNRHGQWKKAVEATLSLSF